MAETLPSITGIWSCYQTRSSRRNLSVTGTLEALHTAKARQSFGCCTPTRSPSVRLQPAHDAELAESFQTVRAPPRTANVVASSKPATPAESARKRRRAVPCAGAPSALACTRGLTRARSRPSGTASRPTLTSPPARRTGEQQQLNHLHHGSRGSPRTPPATLAASGELARLALLEQRAQPVRAHARPPLLAASKRSTPAHASSTPTRATSIRT